MTFEKWMASIGIDSFAGSQGSSYRGPSVGDVAIKLSRAVFSRQYPIGDSMYPRVNAIRTRGLYLDSNLRLSIALDDSEHEDLRIEAARTFLGSCIFVKLVTGRQTPNKVLRMLIHHYVDCDYYGHVRTM